MSATTKNKPGSAPRHSASELFDQLGILFNKPTALTSPDNFARELEKPFSALYAIPRHELDAVQTVLQALLSQIDTLIPVVARRALDKAAALHLPNRSPGMATGGGTHSPDEHASKLVGSAPDDIAALEEDMTVRAILDEVRRRKARPMSTRESVREGAGLMTSMRATSAATLRERIDKRELITSSEMQEKLGIRRQSISDAVKSGRLFAMVGPSGENYYPAFYADERFDRRAIEKVSKALGTLPASSKFFFFTTKLSTLQETPLQALEKGRVKEVLVAAASFALF
ncbi:hypothetical protein IV454_01570 [Massilia antarctica]|uniref:Uncharacterized protein n=1 Tax=Massilia antarctica TaxID=2765360 RepID=A0AA48WD61_9BURK|nr:hypothetical protein [Massilia antarctica]QPI50351.1 hypothetical protein IV454_01570 [Massilia antarctica]